MMSTLEIIPVETDVLIIGGGLAGCMAAIKACEQPDLPTLREYCHQLKGSGCSYGFQNLTVAAIAALNAISADPTGPESQEKLAVLAGLCRSVQFHDESAAA